MQFPIYPPIAALAQTLHARVRRWPLGANAEVDLDHLAALLAEGNVRAIVVNHPHSPTGALLSAGELTAIAALAADFGATLIVDEVHRGIQFAGEVLPPAADFGAHVVSIGDLAKPYGLGGIRIGWLATSNAALRARCAQLRDYTSLSSSVPGEFLGALAVEHRAAILERHLDTARANRASFAAAMDGKTWMAWRMADGGFTIFPRSTLPQPTLALCQALFDRYGVLLLPGEVFDCPGYLRLGFGVVSTDFEAGLERLLAYIQSVE
jgi:aspartate/methionine/tyrosine aminotransferase